jgi:hypothetical protein
VADVLRWVGRLLRVALRRAAIGAVLIAVFALAVWWTTRETYSDCGDVTAEQNGLLESLREPSPDRSFRAESRPACVQGVFSAPIVGLGDDMEAATTILLADRLELDREFLPFFYNEWRRCFRFADPAWERIELNVRSDRAGRVQAVDATAPEKGDACELVPGVG